MALNPTLSRAQLNLGVALAKQGKIEAAIGPLKAAARLNTDSPQASYYLGSVYAAQNRYAEAEDSFNQALQHRLAVLPRHIKAWLKLFELQGNKEAALRHYRETARLMKQSGAAP